MQNLRDVPAPPPDVKEQEVTQVDKEEKEPTEDKNQSVQVNVLTPDNDAPVPSDVLASSTSSAHFPPSRN